MNSRVLDEQDAQEYQALRLRALQTNPESFGSTYEREVEFSLEAVQARLKPMTDKFVLGTFDERGSLVGTATFVRESGMKFAHKGNVFGMYVAPESRGQGIGTFLINKLIMKVKDCEGLEQINLTVVSNNLAAKELYKSVGFEVFGTERNALKYNGEYYDEDLMVIQL
ncbi:GNAT family N-acetyltransferase [Radiobacillus sp. PE A8.2]|uniref:GNAT family N-acetyltransferase n=1 Tax=Radiobacillus sp. PE A8.2 TaxID=3380349 RepID=UPI00389006BA